MKRLLRSSAGLLVAAIVSGAYWAGMLALLERATTVDGITAVEPGDGALMVRAVVWLVLATVIYAAALVIVGGRRNVGAIAASLGFSIIAGLYWAVIAFFLLGITAGDTRDGVAPDRAMQRTILICTLICAPVVFAAVIEMWRRISRLGQREY